MGVCIFSLSRPKWGIKKMHPYVPFKIVPESLPSRRIILPINFQKLDFALIQTLNKISERNKKFIPRKFYEKLKK